jgi:hypothetical protein
MPGMTVEERQEAALELVQLGLLKLICDDSGNLVGFEPVAAQGGNNRQLVHTARQLLELCSTEYQYGQNAIIGFSPICRLAD